MDVVDALNRYRFAVVRDPQAFSILSYLYINDCVDENDLSGALGLRLPQAKSRIRDLYKARLLDLVGNSSVRITPAASKILAGLNADEHLVPELLRAATTSVYQSASEELYKFVTKADRNIKVEIRDKILNISKLPHQTSSAVTNFLILFSMVPPDSVSRSALKTMLTQVKPKAFGKSLGSKTESVYVRLARAIDDSDAMLRYAATDVSARRNFSDAGKSYTIWRLFSYLRSDHTDPVLEASHLINPNLAETVWGLSFKKAPADSFFYDSCESAARVWDMPFRRDEPQHMTLEITDLFRRAFQRKNFSTYDDVVALIPPLSKLETGQGSMTLADLVVVLGEILAQFSGTMLPGADAERDQAKGLLKALQDKIVAASPKK